MTERDAFLAGIELAASEAEHWQKIGDRPDHQCGAYIASAIRAVGKIEAEKLAARDSKAEPVAQPTDGELWSWVRKIMQQGVDIHQDHREKGYEVYSAHLDDSAATRARELATIFAVSPEPSDEAKRGISPMAAWPWKTTPTGDKHGT